MSIKQSDLDQKWLIILNSQDSQAKKNKLFRQIKMGLFEKIMTTHAEIFQDFANLKKITIIDPHKRYYSNQQDPRYKTPDVVAKMAEIRSADLKIIGD
jgi:primosomal protein N'